MSASVSVVVKYVAGYFVACVLGEFVTRWCVDHLWTVAPENRLRTHPTVRKWQGFTERALYTTTIVLGRPEGIAVWLAFKALMRVKANAVPEGRELTNGDRPKYVSASGIYLTGTAISLAFGVAGGLIANWPDGLWAQWGRLFT